MRHRLLFLAFIPVFFMSAVLSAAKPAGLSKINVMSYNIRQGEANDGTNSWQFRYPATAMMIEDRLPDVMGVQEAYSYQLLFITENCINIICKSDRKNTHDVVHRHFPRVDVVDDLDAQIPIGLRHVVDQLVPRNGPRLAKGGIEHIGRHRDGGKGGSVYLRGNHNYWTLLHLKYQRHVFAEHGGNGGKDKCHGTDGKDVYIEVPCGTVVTDNKRHLKVAAADGYVELLTMQFPGKKRMKAEEVLCGHKFDTTTRFA